MALSADAKKRKDTPMARGLLDYFPDACAAVAELSRIGNEQHQPGEPMHWAREKSTDHADCIVRHLVERGTVDADGVRHSTKVAWRALALAQLEIEEEREKLFATYAKVVNGPESVKSREDYPSRWLMRAPNGREWETSNYYTFAKVSASFQSEPVLRLPAEDPTVCDDIRPAGCHEENCPCYTCAKARRDAAGKWE